MGESGSYEAVAPVFGVKIVTSESCEVLFRGLASSVALIAVLCYLCDLDPVHGVGSGVSGWGGDCSFVEMQILV